jgi:hypothetical protein
MKSNSLAVSEQEQSFTPSAPAAPFLKVLHQYGDLPELKSKRTARDVLAYLAFRCGKGDTCFPSVETISDIAMCSRASVFRALALLEELGLIRREYRETPQKRQTSNKYHLLQPEFTRQSFKIEGSQNEIQIRSTAVPMPEVLRKNDNPSPSTRAEVANGDEGLIVDNFKTDLANDLADLDEQGQKEVVEGRDHGPQNLGILHDPKTPAENVLWQRALRPLPNGLGVNYTQPSRWLLWLTYGIDDGQTLEDLILKVEKAQDLGEVSNAAGMLIQEMRCANSITIWGKGNGYEEGAGGHYLANERYCEENGIPYTLEEIEAEEIEAEGINTAEDFEKKMAKSIAEDPVGHAEEMKKWNEPLEWNVHVDDDRILHFR